MLSEAFSSLLARAEPVLAAHLDKIRIPALSLALPWMACAFVGVLKVGEVLLLWDRIIGFDTLMVRCMPRRVQPLLLTQTISASIFKIKSNIFWILSSKKYIF